MYYTHFQNNKKLMKKITNYSKSHLKAIQKIWRFRIGIKNYYNKSRNDFCIPKKNKK